MKKYFLCTLFTLVATWDTSAFAGDSDRVVFVVKGEIYETPLSELKKITFTGGKLQAHMTDGSCDEYFLADMQKVYFSDVSARTGNVGKALRFPAVLCTSDGFL